MTTVFFKNTLRYLCLGAGACCLFACAQDPQVSVDSELIISPPARELAITELRNAEGRCLFDEQLYQDTPIHILLKTATGSPIGEAGLSVYVDFAGNSFSGLNALALYADSNGNGVVDAPDELVSGVDDDIYRVKTGRYSGSVHLLLRINLSCAYRGRIHAFSGPVSGAMEVNVTATRVTP